MTSNPTLNRDAEAPTLRCGIVRSARYLDGSLLPTLEMIESSVREPEMWAVEGVVMRLLAQWHPGGSKATEAADKAVRLALGE